MLEQQATARGVTVKELKAELRGRWEGWRARPEQCEPAGEWTFWVIKSGRGWGKTLTGAQWAKKKGLQHPRCRIALVAPTIADGRDTMVEGETGLLAVLDERDLRGGSQDAAWNRSLGELFLANGTRFKVFSSEKPARLRGPQHHFAWCDETSSWDDASKGDALETTWSNMLLGLRLGDSPRALVTTTPKKNKLTRDILALDDVVLVSRPTWDNLENLAGTYYERIIKKYVGSRLGRQELEAEILEDTPGALWTHEMFDDYRVFEHPDLARIVVAVDPAASSDPNKDVSETGIVSAGWSKVTGFGYTLRDRSLIGSPAEWARAAVNLYHELEADTIVAEKNNGGEMVKHTLNTVDPSVPVKLVWASRGKRTRAEPVVALYEQGRIHHVGAHPLLEDQCCDWVPDDDPDSPDRMDALVWALTELMVQPRGGGQVSYRPGVSEPVYKRGDLVLRGEKYIDKK